MKKLYAFWNYSSFPYINGALSSTYLIQSPLTVWEDNQFFLVGPITDPQNRAKPLAMFPKDNPESRTNALLFKQLLYKWRVDNNSRIKNK